MCLFLWSICLSKLQQLLLACAAQKCPRMLPKGCCTSKEKLQAQSSQKTGARGPQSPKGACWHGCQRKSSFQGAALEFPSVGEHWALQRQGSKPVSSMQIVKIFPEARAAVWGTPVWVKAPRGSMVGGELFPRWRGESMVCSAVGKLSAPKLWLSCTNLNSIVWLVWMVVGVSSPKHKTLLYLQDRRGEMVSILMSTLHFQLNDSQMVKTLVMTSFWA